MPDYRTIPPTIEGVCRYSLTGKCSVTYNGKPVCPAGICAPPENKAFTDERTTAMKFCIACKHLESETAQAKALKLRPRLCLRPDREILDMVTSKVLATSREQVAARDERKGFDPGACSPEGKFFDPR